MALTNDDLKKIEGVMHKIATGVSGKQTEDLAIAVAKGFEEQREYVDRGFATISETLKQHTQILSDHSNEHRKTRETFADHTKRLERIETKQDAVATTLRDHGRRITELERTR